jgi:predicted dehydrogenase
MIGVALLGAGAGATAHAEALRDLAGAALRVVADPDLERARRLAAPHGAAAVADPETALARDDVAVAVIVAPNHLHGPLARAAAGHGRAVLVEKPLAGDLGEAQAIVDACAARGVPLGLVLQNRFAPAVRALRADLAAGRLGRLVGGTVLVRCDRREGYFQAGPWRARREVAGGGALLIQGIHMLDLLDWLVGPVAVRAAAAATRKHAVGVEDVLSATLELPDGAPAALLVTTAAVPEFPMRAELYGTEGSAVILEARGTVRVWRGGPGGAGLGELAALEGELGARLAAPWPAGTTAALHRALLAEFLEALGAGRRPEVDGDAALRLQRLVEAIYAAARDHAAGRRVAARR